MTERKLTWLFEHKRDVYSQCGEDGVIAKGIEVAQLGTKLWLWVRKGSSVDSASIRRGGVGSAGRDLTSRTNEWHLNAIPVVDRVRCSKRD